MIIDSRATIDIMETYTQGMGIRDHLQPETDVSMELSRICTTQLWVLQDRVEVTRKSQRKTLDPDEFYWECNKIVDQLAMLKIKRNDHEMS